MTDPTCLYDAATQRFFLVVLTLEVVPTTGAFTPVNHLDLAVSQTSNPTGAWNIYRIDVTNDGTNTGGVNPGPYLGDYPHIGADANGFYLTTNAYPWCCNGFAGAQIYAFSKAQLAAGAASVTMVHIDTSGTVNAPSDAGATQPGFTVWPAQSPGTSSFNTSNGGTEYFLSSNAADEATHPVAGTGGSYTSSQLVVWTLTNTSSLNTRVAGAQPDATRSLGVGPVRRSAEAAAARLGDARRRPTRRRATASTTRRPPTIAGVGCWRLLFGGRAGAQRGHLAARLERHPHAAGDVRQRQAVGRARHGAQPRRRRAAGRHRLVHRQPERRQASSTQGYLGADRLRLHLSGHRRHRQRPRRDGVHRHRRRPQSERRLRGDRRASSASARGTSSPAAQGAAPDDGFTSYKSQVGNPPRTRWGDYGAAAVDGNSVWIASEYIASACNYTDLGRPVLRGRHRRQPARHVRRRQPRARARAPRSATGRRGSAS